MVSSVYGLLKKSIRSGDIRMVNKLLMVADIDVDEISRAGGTHLHESIVYKNDNIVRALLEAGADIEIKNAVGDTPLVAAARSNNSKIVNTLAEYGADLSAIKEVNERLYRSAESTRESFAWKWEARELGIQVKSRKSQDEGIGL